jgi:Cu(I)/Ag(I) efflux system membrane fusion protein
MNRLALLALMTAGGLLVAACGDAPAPSNGTAATQAAGHAEPAYQCPMHPEVTSDRPGQCPICGMDLVPVRPAAAQAGTRDAREPLYYRHPHDPTVTSPVPRKDEMGMDFVPVYASGDESTDGALQLSAVMVSNLGVRTAPVRHGTLGGTVDAVGTVAYDERGRVEVRVRTDGYVERLVVRAEGEPVRRGQSLFSVFSPRLAAAQREYLAAASLGEPALAAAAAERLHALGLDRGAIERLKATGQATERVSYFAPVDGVVTMLGVREGSLAEPGMSAMTLVPVDRIWVVADIPEADAARVEAGAAAGIRFPSIPGERFEGRVLEVLPQLDAATRSVQARIPLENPGGRLAAGMLSDVIIEGNGAGHGLLVPQEALIRTGRSERVIVALGEGRFAPREVRAGAESGPDIEILEGLQAGEEVVVSGQFMIDSESQVRSSLRRFEQPTPLPAEDHGAHEDHSAHDGHAGHEGHPDHDAHAGHDEHAAHDGHADHAGRAP